MCAYISISTFYEYQKIVHGKYRAPVAGRCYCMLHNLLCKCAWLSPLHTLSSSARLSCNILLCLWEWNVMQPKNWFRSTMYVSDARIKGRKILLENVKGN